MSDDNYRRIGGRNGNYDKYLYIVGRRWVHINIRTSTTRITNPWVTNVGVGPSRSNLKAQISPKIAPWRVLGGSLEGPGRVLEGPRRVPGGSREGPRRVPEGFVLSHVR